MLIIGMTSVILASCQKQDEVSEVTEPVKTYVLADLALSLPASPAARTRMLSNVTQTNGIFRGIQKLSIIPFTTQGKVTSTDMPSYYESSSVVSTGWTVVDNIHHYQKLYLMHGVASFLTYGEAKAETGGKPINGSLIPKVSGQSQTEGIMPDRLAVTPANLTFELEKIYKESTTPAGATAIANYLTHIARAEGTIPNPETDGNITVSWKDAEDSWLQLLYLNFTNQSDQDANIMPGSARNVKALVNTLYTRLSAMNYNDGSIEKAIVADILSRITNETYVTTVGEGNTLTVNSLVGCDKYPNDLDLPDGAAAVRWDKDTTMLGSNEKGAFLPQTVTTLDAPINTISRFAYPPALYYYSNSRIKASNNDVEASAYTGKSWTQVMSDVTLYPYDNAVVNGNTKAVAIKEPLQYGVAHLSATIASTASSLPDADGTPIEVGSNFPVTGIIICGQRPVDFEFKVKMDNGQPTSDELFMYDSYLKPPTDASPFYLKFGDPASGPFETLVLQTEDGKDVTIMLELENNSVKNFKGEDGYIYKGTKFYLTGQVKLNQGSDSGVADSEKEDVKKRVFTQDHTTKMTMKVQTLAHAYNVMPNILAGRLQIGVDIKLNWVEAEPSTVILTGEEPTNGD
jgi:hypothetical protein